jgi:hypothetical protein
MVPTGTDDNYRHRISVDMREVEIEKDGVTGKELQPTVKFHGIYSARRQAKKATGLTGRQWVKRRKWMQRAQRHVAKLGEALKAVNQAHAETLLKLASGPQETGPAR